MKIYSAFLLAILLSSCSVFSGGTTHFQAYQNPAHVQALEHLDTTAGVYLEGRSTNDVQPSPTFYLEAGTTLTNIIRDDTASNGATQVKIYNRILKNLEICAGMDTTGEALPQDYTFQKNEITSNIETAIVAEKRKAVKP